MAGELTLRDISERVLREDAEDLVYVHARADIGSAQFSTLEGDALSVTVNEMKVLSSEILC